MSRPGHTETRPRAEGPDNSGGAWEASLVWNFFGRRPNGFFVDVGANHPVTANQTWLLERQGWSGILVEPNPELCRLLRQQRTRSLVVEAAACAPEQVGEADLHIGISDEHSAINPIVERALTGKKVRVRMQTLRSIIEEAGVQWIDFLSVDVENMELDVLRGFDLNSYRVPLILLEDPCYSFRVHKYMRQQDYKLVRRTGYNNWYVPAFMPVSVFSASTLKQLTRLFRKMWLNTPFNILRRALERRRG